MSPRRTRFVVRCLCIGVGVGLVGAGVGGCVSAPVMTQAPPDEANVTMSEGYSLLHALLEKNRRVNQILFIKSVPEPYAALIRDIAKASANGAKTIETFAQQDESIVLNAAHLPEAESRVRASIESDTSSTLLGTSGTTFMEHLSIAQLKATQYASHLANTMNSMDDDAGRSVQLEQMKQQFDKLYKQLLDTIEHRSLADDGG